MNLEVHADPAARRRSRRGMFLFVVAFILFLPMALLASILINVMIGPEAADRSSGPSMMVGLIAMLGCYLYSTQDSRSYRCPRCGGRTSRVEPQGEPEPNIHWHCPQCRIIWDLGWGSGGGGGGG